MNTRGPGQLLFSFVRHWSRRATSGDATVAAQGRLVLVTEAVNSVIERKEPATINAVAHELGLDQSGASRLISGAAVAGYLILVAAASDGRRREVLITSAGRAALEYAHSWQEQVFNEMTVGWSQKRRDEFQRAMADLIASSYAIDA